MGHPHLWGPLTSKEIFMGHPCPWVHVVLGHPHLQVHFGSTASLLTGNPHL